MRLSSARQASTASTSRPARPGGRTGSRHPNGSPDDSAPRAIAASSGGTDSQVSSSVRDATRRFFQSRGGRYVAGQSFGSSPASTSSARRSSACRHRKPAASAMSPGSSSTSRVPGPMWSRPVAGARWAAQTSAASPTAIARLASPPAATCSGSVSKRARSAASRSGSRAAARPRRSRIAAAPPAGRRNSDAGSRTALWIAVVVRWSVGSNERNESISSPKNSIRIGSAIDGGKTSTIPPRRADSPRPATSLTGTYPRSNSSRSSASWWSRDPTRSSRGARGRSAGSIVCWRSDWTPATRIRARPFCHAASAATRAAVSSAISSLRS